MAELRRLEPGDAGIVHALLSRMDVVRHMQLPVCSLEESEKFLRDALVESASDPWQSIVRAVRCSPQSGCVGLCGVVILRGSEDGEMWYLLAPEFRRKGIATEAAKHLLEFGFGENPRSVEEQFPVCHARRGMEPRLSVMESPPAYAPECRVPTRPQSPSKGRALRRCAACRVQHVPSPVGARW
jgi:hypothetical protein